MANLSDSPHFAVYDDYYTPKSAWLRINNSIPRDKIIWEACMLGAELSKSRDYLQEHSGRLVIGDKTMDCLTSQPEEWDMIITNIPFDIKKKVPILKRFVELDKPFIVIMNSMNTFTKYFHEIFKDNRNDLQIITPSGKIHFDKLENGVLTPTKNCSFYCVYVCFKMNLSADNLWVN